MVRDMSPVILRWEEKFDEQRFSLKLQVAYGFPRSAVAGGSLLVMRYIDLERDPGEQAMMCQK